MLSPLSSPSSVPDRCYESIRGSSWRGYNVNCCCKRERRDEETGECEVVHFLDFPGPWNNGKCCSEVGLLFVTFTIVL